ncbi:MAG: polysaccharide deacetylase family protein [Beijerinckiaceae bacterium]|nr:polysaccharide deacetylase family protein [Beijerinckiaceae bacterium]
MPEIPWQALCRRLDRCAAEGRTVTFWLRDDDAVEPTVALDRLCALTGHHAVPLLLAIIPKHAGSPLRDYLAAQTHVSPCQHGFSHRNHAPPPERARELGVHRPLDAVLGELALGRETLKALFGDRLANVLVPPWNRIDDEIVPALPQLGFTAISRFGYERCRFQAGLVFVNSDIDIINWRDGRRGRSVADLVGKIEAAIDTTGGTDHPIGILAHHLAHDEAAWSFLSGLFAATAQHTAARWATFDECAALVGTA